jgi:hypothetical protein
LAEGVTAALVAAGVLGLWFPSTRGISVAAVAALTFRFPWLGLLILILSAAAFYLLRIR